VWEALVVFVGIDVRVRGVINAKKRPKWCMGGSFDEMSDLVREYYRRW